MVVVVLLLRKIAQGGVRELVDFDAPGEPFLVQKKSQATDNDPVLNARNTWMFSRDCFTLTWVS